MGKQGPLHASAGSRAGDYLKDLLGRLAQVRYQLPIRLDAHSEPEPDVAVVLPDEDYYSDHHPTPAETLLVVEVSDSTLRFDRVRKSRVYAQAGIRQYCILNLKARELEDHRQPGPNGYRSKQSYTEGESFTLAAFPHISVQVGHLLPALKSALNKRRKK